MTQIDPAAPKGGNEGERTAASEEPTGHEERGPGGGGTYGGGSGGGYGEGPGRGAETGPESNEFLGVEKDFWLRLLYMIAAGFVAWVSFWFVIILAVAQIIYRLAAGHPNEDLRGFTRNMIQYVHDLLAFVTLVRDERPFLFGGKFPGSRESGL